MKRVIMLALISLFAFGGSSAFAEKTQKVDADNSKKNAYDRNKSKATAEDQSNEKGDVAVTAAIRKSIMDTKGLSVNAQNVKIITENGTIFLRGPVDSQQEKDVIAGLAKSACGKYSVKNELEVKTSK